MGQVGGKSWSQQPRRLPSVCGAGAPSMAPLCVRGSSVGAPHPHGLAPLSSMGASCPAEIRTRGWRPRPCVQLPAFSRGSAPPRRRIYVLNYVQGSLLCYHTQLPVPLEVHVPCARVNASCAQESAGRAMRAQHSTGQQRQRVGRPCAPPVRCCLRGKHPFDSPRLKCAPTSRAGAANNSGQGLSSAGTPSPEDKDAAAALLL